MEIRDVLPRDAIPSIDDPEFGRSSICDPDDEVVFLEADPPRAYPVRILSFHEIVNDTVDGEPLAVTWCPLCGSAVVYERRLDGRTLTFGVSGKLADDLVMYDRETESEWKQSTGTCIAGEFAGATLTVRPASVTTLTRFREAYPEGVVLQPVDAASEAASDDDEPAPIDYDLRPYEAYFQSDGIGLAAHRVEDDDRSWDRDDLDVKAVVLGVERDGQAVGYPRPRVEAAGASSRTRSGTSTLSCSPPTTGFTPSRTRGTRSRYNPGRSTLTGRRGTRSRARARTGDSSTESRAADCSRSPGRTTTGPTRST